VGVGHPATSVGYAHVDALGSVRAVTDGAEALLRRHEFLPFGEEWQAPVPPPDVRLFTGQERDAATGLDYFGARYYRSDLGRFTTPDPMGEGASLYAYVGSNPLRFVDPFGLQRADPPGSPSNPFKVTIFSCGTLEECLKNEAADAAAREAFDRFLYEHWFQLLAGDVTQRAGAPASPRTYLEFYGLSAVGGLGLGSGLHLFGAASLTTLNLQGAAPLLPVVASALGKLQGIGLSVQGAAQIVPSPTSQRLIDTANSNNINVIQQVGDKLIRITLDPTGQRIISAGYVQARNIANGIASGRFIPK
jgi:RHS repeat-associated protein